MKLKITDAPVMYQGVSHGTTTTVAVEVDGRRLEGLAVGRTSKSGVGVDLMLIEETLTLDLGIGELGKSSWLGLHCPPEGRLEQMLDVHPNGDNEVLFRLRMDVEGRQMDVAADRWRIAAVLTDYYPHDLIPHAAEREQEVRDMLLRPADLLVTVPALPLLTAMTLIKPRSTWCSKPAWAFVSDDGALFLEGGKASAPMRYKLTEDLQLPELQVLVDAEFLRFALQYLTADDEVTLGLQKGGEGQYSQRQPLQVRRDDELHAIMPLTNAGWTYTREKDADPGRSLVDVAMDAVRYVLDQAQTNPDLYYELGWGTEAFRRLCAAEAMADGRLAEHVERRRRDVRFDRERRVVELEKALRDGGAE